MYYHESGDDYDHNNYNDVDDGDDDDDDDDDGDDDDDDDNDDGLKMMHGCPSGKGKMHNWYSTKAFPLRKMCPFAVFGW